jgi:hypothetical protein
LTAVELPAVCHVAGSAATRAIAPLHRSAAATARPLSPDPTDTRTPLLISPHLSSSVLICPHHSRSSTPLAKVSLLDLHRKRSSSKAVGHVSTHSTAGGCCRRARRTPPAGASACSSSRLSSRYPCR